MGLAMAAMLSPWGDPVPARLGVVAFAVSGAWFGSVALGRGPARSDARHLAIASVAMIVMYLAGAHSGADSPAGGHAAHGASAGLSGLLLGALSLLLAGYFVGHAWHCADRSRAAHTEPGSTVAVRGPTATRVAPVAHGVMSALMATMFLGAT